MSSTPGGARWRSANDPRLSREQILDLLRQNPERIAAAVVGLDPAFLGSAPAEGQWAPTTILAHLRACADVWGSCILRILREDTPTIRAVGPRTYIHQTDYPDLDFAPSFDAFIAQRADLLATLQPLAADAWGRTAIVSGAGGVLVRTLNWYALGLAAHERSHLRQIRRLAAGATGHG